ncbi:MAG: acyltransferase, partial [Desulfatiglandales bacterium]|nr:acyltransferase [Desulfatiglandales bacterium]
LKEYKKLKDLYKVETRNPTVLIEEGVQILNRKNLFLGKHIHIAKGTILHCGGGEWCNNGGKITIGDHVAIASYSILYGAGEIEIGDRCQFGPGVMVIAQSLDMDTIRDETTLDRPTAPHVFSKVTLEEGVMVGAGSTILMGVTLGRGAYIAGGSVIKKDVPPYSFVIPRTRYKTINRNSTLVVK